MSVLESRRGRRRSADQPGSRIEFTYVAGLTSTHVQNDDVVSPHAERVNGFLHINNAGEAQLGGCNPLRVSGLRVDLPKGRRNNDNRRPALGTNGSSKIRVELSASAE